MAGILNTLIDLIVAKINTDKAAIGTPYPHTDFSVARSWLPLTELTQLAAGEGEVFVVGQSGDETPIQSRTGMSVKIVPIQVGLRRAVEGKDDPLISSWVDLEEDIRDSCRKAVLSTGYTWQRNVALKDPDNEMPFSYIALRSMNIFESYFTAYYQVQIT